MNLYYISVITGAFAGIIVTTVLVVSKLRLFNLGVLLWPLRENSFKSYLRITKLSRKLIVPSFIAIFIPGIVFVWFLLGIGDVQRISSFAPLFIVFGAGLAGISHVGTILFSKHQKLIGRRLLALLTKISIINGIFILTFLLVFVILVIPTVFELGKYVEQKLYLPKLQAFVTQFNYSIDKTRVRIPYKIEAGIPKLDYSTLYSAYHLRINWREIQRNAVFFLESSVYPNIIISLSVYAFCMIIIPGLTLWGTRQVIFAVLSILTGYGVTFVISGYGRRLFALDKSGLLLSRWAAELGTLTVLFIIFYIFSMPGKAKLSNSLQLMKIRGVGYQYVKLLVASGIYSPDDLLEYTPEELLETLKRRNEKSNIIQRAPTLREIRHWIQQIANTEKIHRFGIDS